MKVLRRYATVVWTYCKACEDIEIGLVNMPKGIEEVVLGTSKGINLRTVRSCFRTVKTYNAEKINTHKICCR